MGWSEVFSSLGRANDNKRLLFVLTRMGLGILLLSDISFNSTYPAVYEFPIERAGLTPLNTSLTNTPHFNETATAEFWWYFPALLTDSKRVYPVAPLHCSGDLCRSLLVPGTMDNMVYDPSQPNITQDTYPQAISYIQNDAPGYQVEFYPVDTETDPPLSLYDDCRVYGLDFMAVQICLKKVNNSFIAGNNSLKLLLTPPSLDSMPH
jgi:hypothetical protein